MPPGPGPAQVTPEEAAAQLVADASQGATEEGEAEQEVILAVDPPMSMVVEGLMMVTDVAEEKSAM